MPTPVRNDLRRLTATSFLEGPAADTQGQLFFSDILGNRIVRWTAAEGNSVFRENAGRANGNVLTRSGWLYTAEGGEMGPGGGRRIVRTEVATGRIEVLTERFEGRRYNSPNDLTVDEDGVVWFTDPRYGARDDLELEVEGVYRIDVDGTVTRVLDQEHVERPNGIALAPDGTRLYVVDSHPRVGGSRRVLVATIEDDGTLGVPEVLVNFGGARGGDGIKVDSLGRLYVCAGVLEPRSEGESADRAPGVYVYESNGELVEFHPVPLDLVTNCCFGGADARTLFVTAGHTVFQAALDVPGHLV
jgi:gluconolactonase